jgi:hypothetical protein
MFFRDVKILAHNQATLGTIDRWVNALESTILPSYEPAIARLEDHAQLRSWGDKYRVVRPRRTRTRTRTRQFDFGVVLTLFV